MPRMLTVLAVLPSVVLGACSSDSDLTGPAPEPSPTPTSAASAPTSDPDSGSESCDLLEPDQVAELAGQSLDPSGETQVGGVLPACVWGSLNDVGVQASVVDAGLWARTLPDLVDTLKASGVLDEENLGKLERAASLVDSGSDIPADRACPLFSDLVELNGLPQGSDLTVNVMPSADDPQAISAQACRAGTFASVLVVRPDLASVDVEGVPTRRVLESLLD